MWNDSGRLLAFITEDTLFVLRYDHDSVQVALQEGTIPSDGGLEEAMDVVHDANERFFPSLLEVGCSRFSSCVSRCRVGEGLWIGDVFVFTTKNQRLQYLVGDRVFSIAHLDKFRRNVEFHIWGHF